MPDLTRCPPRFTTADVAKIQGVTIPTVKHWCKERVLIPAIEAPRGRTRYFDDQNLFEAATINFLSQRGLSMSQLRTVMDTQRARIAATVEPEAGFDLYARAACAFYHQALKGLLESLGLGTDPVLRRYLTKLETGINDKERWRMVNLEAFVPALLGGAREATAP